MQSDRQTYERYQLSKPSRTVRFLYLSQGILQFVQQLKLQNKKYTDTGEIKRLQFDFDRNL